MHFECDILNSNLKQTITQCGATQDFAISSDGMAFSFKGHLHTTWTDFDSLQVSLFLKFGIFLTIFHFYLRIFQFKTF